MNTSPMLHSVDTADPEDAFDGMLERAAEAAFQNLRRRWGFEEAVERLAKIVLKESNWKTIDG